MTILFEPKFLIGDTVYLKINPEVSYFQYSMYDDQGTKYRY